jgi:PEP-CTERM motif
MIRDEFSVAQMVPMRRSGGVKMRNGFARVGTFVLLALVTFVTTAMAGPVNCALTPSDPACAPSLLISYHPSGGGPITITTGGTPVYSNGSWLVPFVPQMFPAFLFTGGQATSAPDPLVGFSFGVINTSPSNQTFSYDFVTPFAGGPYYQAQTLFADTLINTNFSGTTTVTPFGDKYIMESYVNGVLISGFGRGTGCTTGGTYVCTSGAVGGIGPVPYLSPATGTLEVKGSFILTPGSQYILTGRTELLPAPEPGSLALLGTGVIGLAGVLRRRLRNRQ